MSDRHREPGMDDAIDLRLYLEILWRRRALVGVVTVVALSVAAFLNFVVLTPTYEASATLIVVGPRFQVAGPTLKPASVSPVTVENLVPVVHSEAMAAQVLKRLPPGAGGRARDLIPKVIVTPIRGTNLLKITARDSSPGEAAALAGAWGEVVVEYGDSLAQDETLRALSALEGQIGSAQRELAAADRSLVDVQAVSKVPLLDGRVHEIVRRIALYEARLAEFAQGGTPAEGEVVLQPRAGTYALTVGATRHPAQIRKVLVALRADLRPTQAALASEKLRETQVLRRVDLAHTTHQTLVKGRADLRVLLGAYTGMVKIAVPPAVPDAPVAPRTMLNMVLAALLGLTAGSVLAIVMERFRAAAPGAVPHPVAAFAPDPSRHDP